MKKRVGLEKTFSDRLLKIWTSLFSDATIYFFRSQVRSYFLHSLKYLMLCFQLRTFIFKGCAYEKTFWSRENNFGSTVKNLDVTFFGCDDLFFQKSSPTLNFPGIPFNFFSSASTLHQCVVSQFGFVMIYIQPGFEK